MCNLINAHTNTHTHISLIPPWEDQCEWHRMTRIAGPDCAVMCNLINTHTHTHTHTHNALAAQSCPTVLFSLQAARVLSTMEKCVVYAHHVQHFKHQPGTVKIATTTTACLYCWCRSAENTKKEFPHYSSCMPEKLISRDMFRLFCFCVSYYAIRLNMLLK